MSWTVKGVVARAEKQPAELLDIIIPDPGPNDVVVDIEATGVCHTDLSYRDGGINDEFPFLLGHESAGRVSAIGEDVTHVEIGDYVVLNWRAVCGECRACKKGVQQYCFSTFNASTPMTLTDGTELTAALGIGSFAEKTLVHEGQCTKVSEDAPAEVAGLLGCGVMAGIGAAINTGGVQRGESLAVIGLGGVGCAAIAGATLAGATTIIGLDVDEQKLEAAKELGATHTLHTKGLSPQQVAEKVQELTGGFGADVVVDAVGIPQTYETAFYARDLAGRVVLVGVPHPDAELTLPLADVFGRGGALKSSWYGDCLPERDFPYLIDLFLQGRLPLDRFVTGRTDLAGVDAALDSLHEGANLRTVAEVARSRATARLSHAVTSGTFSLDGGTHEVDNNVWVLGDDEQCVIFDAPHDVETVEELVGDRECVGILLTHAHDDHVQFAPELSEALEAPLLLNPADREVWQLTHGDLPWDDDVADGDMFTIAGVHLEALHTPGHSPGSTCYYSEELGAVFTGDTLFQGGPGATGRSFSSRETIEESVRERLFALPDDTVVHTGHGPDTTIGAEKRAARGDWL